MFGNFGVFFNNSVTKEMTIYTYKYLRMIFFDYLCRPIMRCGEIWLLATTKKNAKMLN